MGEFEKELKSHKAILHEGKIYYHITKQFIKKYFSFFEDVNAYDMIKNTRYKGYMNGLYVSFEKKGVDYMEKDMITKGVKIMDEKISVSEIDKNIRVVVFKDDGVYHINVLYLDNKWLLIVDRNDARYEKIENVVSEIILQDVNDGVSIAY